MELSKSWQLVAQTSYQVTSNTTGYARLYMKYGNRDTENLLDTIYFEIRQYSYNPYGQYLGWSYAASVPWHIKDVDANYVFASGNYTQPEIYSNSGEAVRASGSFQVSHNEDGTWSSNINFSAYIYTAQTSTNTTISLPRIDRLAKLTSYPLSLTDNDTTITFSYDNPANFKVKPYLIVTQESSIGYEYAEYINANPFSWNWLQTAEDRERLYATVRTSTKATVSLRLRTYNNNDELLGITAVEIPFELVEAEPFVELETEELNESVKDIVNGELIAVNYVSQIKATATFSGGKGSTLKKIRIAGVESDTSPFTTTVKVESEVPSTIYGVVASVEDSRTLTDGDEVIYQLIDYRPVNINTYKFKRENPTSDKIFLDADITYWGITVNGIENTIVISYSTDGKSYIVIPPEAYTINDENKKITISRYAVPTKLHYKEQGTYYLRVVDMFTDDNENEIVTKGIPTTEKGEHDFQVNGDLIICNEDRENPVNVLGKLNNLVVDNLDGEEIDKTPSQRAVKEALADVIESETNDNGSYIKYSDGTLICRGKGEIPALTGGGGTTTKNLPYSFIDDDYDATVTLFGSGAYWSWLTVQVSEKNTGSIKVEYWSNTSNSSDSARFSYIAIGKWK